MIVRKYIIPLLCVGGVALASWVVYDMGKPVTSQPPLITPAINPYAGTISGAGVVEATTENIVVAPALSGIVTDVYVTWGQRVKSGDKLYQIDDRAIKAQIAVQQAAVSAQKAAIEQARANLERLKASPRAEDIPISLAQVQEARANADLARDQWQRIQKISQSLAVTQDELNQRKFTADKAQAAYEAALADHNKLMAGAWKKDIAVAEAELSAAKSQLAAAEAKLVPLQVDLDRLCVRAPVDGSILRLNLRKGNFVATAGTSSASDGPLVLGDVDHFNVRVDVDENDVSRFAPDTPAQAHIRGLQGPLIPLTFVRVEPFVMPKSQLTGASNERIDTRVLQVIYRFDHGELPVFVGQQVDVFIQSPQK